MLIETIAALALVAVMLVVVRCIGHSGFPEVERRTERGLCKACGYPVKGLERCPECGATSTPPRPDHHNQNTPNA